MQQQCVELDQTHWINLLDTGGQASLLDMAPALMRYNSVNIFLHNLVQRLSDKVDFFYCVEGIRVGEETRTLTYTQLLDSLFSARMSLQRPHLEGLASFECVGDPICIVTGTHYDVYKRLKKKGEIKETIHDKDEILSKSLNKYAEFRRDYKSKGGVIFPLNTLSRDKRTLDIAARIRALASQSYVRAKVPALWYIIQIEIHELKAGTRDIVP